MDTGVIAPTIEPALEHAAATQQQNGVEMIQHMQGQALLDLPLPQLPEDMEPIEAPEFVLSQKITEDSQTLGTMPAGLPGLNGTPTPDAQDILGGVTEDVQSLLGDAGATINTAAQGALQQAQGVLNGALGTSTAAAAGDPAAAAAALPTAAALPALPADPIAALMSGLAIPALPGVDVLFKPILDLLSSFGTGIIGALDPTAILSKASEVIDMGMQVTKGSLSTVEQLWEGQASRSAQTEGQQATVQGQDTSQRGIDISQLTTMAAGVVETGNAQLLSIASSFATQATGLAPVIFTPPAQAALIASATEHLGTAVSVVNATRGDLAGKTAELSGMVQQLLGTSGLPAPQEVAAAVAQNIGEPLMSQAKSTLESGIETATGTTGLNTGSPTNTTSASTTTTGIPNLPGTTVGSPGSGIPSSGVTGQPSLGTPTVPTVPSLPGSVVPPVRPVAGMPSTLLGSPTSTSPASTGGPGFMGGAPGAAGQRGSDDEEHQRNVQSYQSLAGNDDLTGPLGESTPDVIGATHQDEIDGSDYQQDQF